MNPFSGQFRGKIERFAAESLLRKRDSSETCQARRVISDIEDRARESSWHSWESLCYTFMYKGETWMVA